MKFLTRSTFSSSCFISAVSLPYSMSFKYCAISDLRNFVLVASWSDPNDSDFLLFDSINLLNSFIVSEILSEWSSIFAN
ncbi:hypothetical protein D3C73_813810 [compost metagenome]